MMGEAAVPEREEAPRPSLGLPIASFQKPPQPPALLPIGRCEPQLEPERNVGMVTTPLRRSIRRRTRRLHSNNSTKSIPRWALPGSPYQAEEFSPLSLASSLTSASLLVSKTVSKISKTSFKWTPEALVQSWHGKLSEAYDILGIIGEGRSGAVFMVQHKRNGRSYACKFLNKSDHEPKALKAEIQTLRRLDHPNVVRLLETHEDGDMLFLLMELCSGGDLLDNISAQGSLGEDAARVFATQMLSALAFCHASGVAHRDVKPENFLLETEGTDCLTVKLADFGIATSIRPEHLSASSSRGPGNASEKFDGSACGSLPYMAPETFRARWRKVDADTPAGMAQLCAADLWSCGVCLYAMLAGRLPFGETEERICSGQPPDLSGHPWDTISEEAIDLIRKLLNPNVRERLTAQQALAHDWLRAYDSEAAGHSSSEGAGTPEACGESSRDLALVVLSGLRRWRQLPKLRRIALCALARRLEAQHDAQRLAESAWAHFCGASDTLRCEQLVRLLHSSLGEDPSPGWPQARDGSCRFAHHSSPAAPTPASVSTAAASPASMDAGRPHGGSITGLHVRQRVRKALRRLASGSPHCGGASAAGSAASLEELGKLVAALDGMKNGVVDYTLLAACLIPADAQFSEARLAEVFGLFDTKKRGFISPGDLQVAVRSDEADLRHYAAMITEFDHDGDGVLDLSEFVAMVQGIPAGEAAEGPSV